MCVCEYIYLYIFTSSLCFTYWREGRPNTEHCEQQQSPMCDELSLQPTLDVCGSFPQMLAWRSLHSL